jgi:hypothetical protein
MRIQEAARRYVRELAPTPPVATLEQVARIVLNARGFLGSARGQAQSCETSSQRGAA